MADAKITALSANTTPALTDIVPMVDDPGGSPVTQKVTVQKLLEVAGAAITPASATVSGLLAAGGAVVFNNEITPTAVAANTNNWNPTGLSTASLIRYSTSGAGSYTLTGIVAQQNGRRILLHNRGTGTLSLASLSGSSSAANQFLCPNNATYVMPAFATVELVYSAAADNYWLVLGPVA